MQTEQPSNSAAANGAVTKTPTEARQGSTPGVVRWVLGISLALAIIGVAIAYLVA